MTKTQRIIKLMLALNNNLSMNSKELAQFLEVSERTIMRDIQELSAANFPVYSELGRDGGYRVLKNKMVPPIRFTEEEVEAIFFAIDSMNNVGGTPFETSFNEVVNKLFHSIPQETNEIISHIREKILLWQPMIKVDNSILRMLYVAMKELKIIKITYKSSNGVKTREIEPVGLYLYNGFWYCPSYCHFRDNIRLFRLDRIMGAEISSKDYSKNIHINVREWLHSEYDESTIKLKVKLNKNGVRKCENIFWLKEALCYKPDGSGSIIKQINRFEVDFYTELIWSIGNDALVIKPQQIKKNILNKASKLIKQYV